jgi:hypothetical protein
MDLTITQIGKTDADSGYDEFLLIENKEDALTPDQAEAWLLPQVYRDSYRAGGYFCHYVSGSQYPYSDNKVIAIVHHRYDI